jgi:hypothetical protein
LLIEYIYKYKIQLNQLVNVIETVQ